MDETKYYIQFNIYIYKMVLKWTINYECVSYKDGVQTWKLCDNYIILTNYVLHQLAIGLLYNIVLKVYIKIQLKIR